MVNWIPIVAATLAALPPAAIFFVAYGRYDGAFRDQVVFLYFIGGMLVGGLLGFFILLLLGANPLVMVIGLALLLPIASVAAINRRKWQGERHAVFNGGASGLGIAVMISFSFLYYAVNIPYQTELAPLVEAWKANNSTGMRPTIPTAGYAFDLAFLGQGLLFATGAAGIFFGMGLLAGNGVRLRKQFRFTFLGAAILFAPVVLLEEYGHSRSWTWVALLAAYGLIFAFAAERKILIEGVTEDARKQRRRLRRKPTQE